MFRREKVRLIIVAVAAIAAAFVVFPVSGRVKLGLDLMGGARILLQAVGTPEDPLTSERMNQLVAVLRNRVDQYGIVEPQIQIEGVDRVAVDLPGVEDPEAAIELIGRTAVLQFRQVVGGGGSPPPNVERHNYDSEESYDRALSNWNELMEQYELQVAALGELVEDDPSLLVARDQDTGMAYVLGEVYVTGSELADASATVDELGQPAVSIRFNREGAAAFEEATAANIGRQIAIVLDDVVISAPVVQSRIGAEGRITGRFTREEAIRLQVMLRAGSLPLNVEILENRSVGPTLGSDSIQSGVRAGIAGAVMVAIFMLIYYGLLGIAADLAIAVAMLVMMAFVIMMRVTLTLPGIGGIILTIGMAVDGNILIYERIKEELRTGKSIMASIDSGFRKALVVILDSNITTLIAAGVLFYFGTGPIRGFAVTLSLGIVASMFGNIIVTRTILQLMLRFNKNLAL